MACFGSPIRTSLTTPSPKAFRTTSHWTGSVSWNSSTSTTSYRLRMRAHASPPVGSARVPASEPQVVVGQRFRSMSRRPTSLRSRRPAAVDGRRRCRQAPARGRWRDSGWPPGQSARPPCGRRATGQREKHPARERSSTASSTVSLTSSMSAGRSPPARHTEAVQDQLAEPMGRRDSGRIERGQGLVTDVPGGTAPPLATPPASTGPARQPGSRRRGLESLRSRSSAETSRSRTRSRSSAVAMRVNVTASTCRRDPFPTSRVIRAAIVNVLPVPALASSTVTPGSDRCQQGSKAASS